MTRQTPLSRDAAYFKSLYDVDPDPWNFSASAYEHQKYHASIAALAGRRFSSAFEIGCSIGILTRLLAPYCNKLLAVDVVDSALAAARDRCGDMPHVSFAKLSVPEQWPASQTFDLILLSEVLYFFNSADIDRIAAHATASLSPNGVVLLVNYTGPIDEPNGGHKAAEIFINAAQHQLYPAHQETHKEFRIDRLEWHAVRAG